METPKTSFQNKKTLNKPRLKSNKRLVRAVQTETENHRSNKNGNKHQNCVCGTARGNLKQ